MKKIKLTAKTQALMGKSAKASASDKEVFEESKDALADYHMTLVNTIWKNVNQISKDMKSSDILQKYGDEKDAVESQFESFDAAFSDMDGAMVMLINQMEWLAGKADSIGLPKSYRASKADYAEVARPIVEKAASIQNELDDLLEMARNGGTASRSLLIGLTDAMEALQKMQDFI